VQIVSDLIRDDVERTGFSCGKLYAMEPYETPYLYCRTARCTYGLINVENGNYWSDDMDSVNPNRWVDVTHLYELRRLANG
jgi:hypothetical protein